VGESQLTLRVTRAFRVMKKAASSTQPWWPMRASPRTWTGPSGVKPGS